VWEDASGAALWAQLVDGALVGAHPFLASAGMQSARVEGAEEDQDSPLDGQARLYLAPEEAVLLPVDVVNWPMAAGALSPQAMVRARIAAFAEGWEAWDSAEAYLVRHPEARRQDVRRMVPTGLYPRDKGGTGRATASITGIVQHCEDRVNSLTGEPFLVMRLETAGATLDAVGVGEAVPSPGAVVRGHFWLAAVVDTGPA